MSNFVVSARKYRPITFEDVVGQEHISKTLKNALKSDHVAHAFLFCGPRGVGKTTCARILAKILNCENRTPEYEACDSCNSCKAFSENASFNIVELDAASNNSVEHIRSLTEQVRFQPQQGRYKVFIIDEVHMLSTAAFNAFLKTLEEPPPYAIFILATTEKHKIIPTILSRCQIYDFRRIQVADVVTHLMKICRKEEIEAEQDALHIIGQKADGALRDALSIFDRITSFSGKKIAYQDVIENLNILDYDYYFRLVDAFMVEDIAGVMLLFNEILRKGFDPEIFINGLAEHLRNLLVCKDQQTLSLLEVSGTLKEKYRTQAKLLPNSFILTALNLANDCDINFKLARNKNLHTEIYLIKMTFIQQALASSQNLSDSSDNQEKKKSEPSIKIPEQPIQKLAEPAPENFKIEEKKEEIVEKKPTLPKEKPLLTSKLIGPSLGSLASIEAEIIAQAEEKSTQTIPLNIQSLKPYWMDFCETLEPHSKNKLKETELKVEKNHIIATVFSQFAEGLLNEERLKLMDFLKEKYQTSDIILEVQLDNSRMEEQKAQIIASNRPISDRDKYLKMVETNPQVEVLRKLFDLRPDSE